MRKLMLVASLAAGILAPPGAGAAAAQDLPADTTVPGAGRRALPVDKWAGLDLITGAIEGGAAAGAGTGSRAYGAQLRLGLTARRVLTLSTDLGIVGMSDEQAFSQETTGGEMTSGVAAGMGSLALGVRTPPLGTGGASPATVSAGVNAGYTLLHATRTITNCADCHGEDVALRAGAFWEARYRTYQGRSDIRDALVIGGTWRIPGVRARTPAPEAGA
jgi:hypothetical protein